MVLLRAGASSCPLEILRAYFLGVVKRLLVYHPQADLLIRVAIAQVLVLLVPLIRMRSVITRLHPISANYTIIIFVHVAAGALVWLQCRLMARGPYLLYLFLFLLNRVHWREDILYVDDLGLSGRTSSTEHLLHFLGGTPKIILQSASDLLLSHVIYRLFFL